MNITTVSSGLPAKKIEYMSFSTFRKMQSCIFRALPGNSISTDVAKNRPLVVGEIFHHLLQLTSTLTPEDESFHEKFDDFYSSAVEEAFLSLKKQGMERFAEELRYWSELADIYQAALRANENATPRFREVELYDTENRIRGIVDEISKDGSRIIEYKSFDTRQKLESEVVIDQIHLYAHLVKCKYGKYPSDLIVRGFHHEVLVEFELDRVNRLVGEIQELIRKIETSGSDYVSLCTTSEDVCIRCDKNVFCPAVQSAYRADLFRPENCVLHIEVIAESADGQPRILSKGGFIEPGQEVRFSDPEEEKFYLEPGIYAFVNIEVEKKSRKLVLNPATKAYRID